MTQITSDLVWNDEINYALGIYRLITKILGVWPLNSQPYFSISLFLLHCLLQITMIMEVFGEICIQSEKIDTQTISNVSCTFLALIKLLTIHFKRLQVQYILESLADLWNSETTSEFFKIMRPKVKLARNICFYQLGFTYLVVLPLVLSALPVFSTNDDSTLNDSEPVLRTFPIQSSHVFVNIPSWSYYIIFIVQAMQLYSTCTGNIGIDCLFFGMAMSLVGQIEYVALNLQNIDLSTDEICDQQKLHFVIKKHNQFIKLAEHMEDTFNIIIFCIVGSNVSQVCLYGIQILKGLNGGDAVVAINSGICIIILNFQIFLYSWAGDQLSSSLEIFKSSSFNCEWYNAPIKFRKKLLFIMMRTYKKYSLTAGKIYRMDLDSFKNIMKAIASYFSVMQAMFEE